MSLLDKIKGVRYRARIFDHDLFLFSVEVPARGQNKIEVTLSKKILGFIGEEIKIGLMINPEIRPKLFGGYIQEIDFDIRDAAQLADLLKIMPDFVYKINADYKLIKEMQDTPGIEALTEPLPVSVPLPDGTTEKPEDKKTPPAPKKPGFIKTSQQLMDIIAALKQSENPEKAKLIKECMDACSIYPSFFYWLPHYLGIDQEIKAIVSQTKIMRVGIMPSYYIKQSNAQISEKVLARPPQKQGWEQVILVIGVLAFALVLFGLFLHAIGRL